MEGKLFCTSKEKDENGECRFQTITNSKKGDVFLFKLFNNKVNIQIFRDFTFLKRISIDIEKDDWNYLLG